MTHFSISGSMIFWNAAPGRCESYSDASELYMGRWPVRNSQGVCVRLTEASSFSSQIYCGLPGSYECSVLMNTK